MNKNKALILAVAISSLTACAATNSQNIDADTKIPDKVPYDSIKELKAISVETRHELRLLAKSQESVNAKKVTEEQHKQKIFQATYVPEDFKQRVDFNYTGELESALEAVTTISGWGLKVVGKKHFSPTLVNINLSNEILYEALREAGAQSGDQTLIEVYPSNKTIIIKYL